MNKSYNKKATKKKNFILLNKESIKKIKSNVSQVSNSSTSCSKLSVKTPINDEIEFCFLPNVESDLFKDNEALKDAKGFWTLRHNYEKRKEEAAKRVCLHFDNTLLTIGDKNHI